MRNTVLSIALLMVGSQAATAQTVIDTVNTTPAYASNVWYSLENDDQATSLVNNWHIALATDMTPSGELITSALFNHKLGSVYEIPGSNPANFSTVDTTGLSTWAMLENSELSWAAGAFNNTANLGTFDYGWGNYNTTTHGIEANRIFVIKFTAGGYRKLMISSDNVAGNYTVVHSNLDNSDMTTEVIAVSGYATKNFVYYNTITKAVLDREPAKTTWDLYFGQYLTEDQPYPYNLVTGILQNLNVEVAQVYPVNDVAAYTNYQAATFEEEMNVFGWDWKSFNGTAYSVADSTVYFVDDVDGDIWKVVMTGFTGSSQGKYMFSKQKMTSSAGIDENAAGIFASVYPNPSNDVATVILKNAPAATVSIYSMMGTLVSTQSADAQNMTAVQLNTAELANGTYHVVCATGTAVSTQRLVVQH